MNNIKPVRNYAYRDKFGRTLTMILGVEQGVAFPYCCRVKLVGSYIPFPVRSDTWFVSGLGIEGLRCFMRDCGYVLVSTTSLHNGHALTCDLHENVYDEIDVESFKPVEEVRPNEINYARNIVVACAKQLLADDHFNLAIRLLRHTEVCKSLADAKEFLQQNRV